MRRGSSEANRLKSGAGNYRFTPLAKIRYWEATLSAERIEKTPNEQGRRKKKTEKKARSIAHLQPVLTRNPYRASLLVIESADPVVRRGRPPSFAKLTEGNAEGLFGVVGTGCEGSLAGKRGRTRLSRGDGRKGLGIRQRSPRSANEKSEGRVVPRRPGNAGGGKAPCFHRVC